MIFIYSMPIKIYSCVYFRKNSTAKRQTTVSTTSTLHFVAYVTCDRQCNSQCYDRSANQSLFIIYHFVCEIKFSILKSK